MAASETTFGAAAGQEVGVDLNDRSSVMKRLDALYMKLGEAAARLTLPAALARSQATAVAASGESVRARGNCTETEARRQAATSRADIIRLDAQLAQAQTEQKKKQVRGELRNWFWDENVSMPDSALPARSGKSRRSVNYGSGWANNRRDGRSSLSPSAAIVACLVSGWTGRSRRFCSPPCPGTVEAPTIERTTQ